MAESRKKIRIESTAYTLAQLRDLVQEAAEAAGGHDFYYTVEITWSGKVKAIKVDASGRALGEYFNPDGSKR